MSIRNMMIGGAGASPPGAPTIGTATGGDASASVTFSAPANNGGSAITGFTVTSSPGGLTATGASSPLTVTGLSNGTAYTFTVTATNAIGTGPASSASNSVTPAAPAADLQIDYLHNGGSAASFSSPQSYTTTGTATVGTYNYVSGYHYFTLPTGAYTVQLWGGEGSGTAHGYGRKLTGTLQVSGNIRFAALVGSPGVANYGGGGMSALATIPGSDIPGGATAIFVAGGGGGGYSAPRNGEADGGGLGDSFTTRRGQEVTSGLYSGGASFGGFHAVEISTNETAAQAFVAGGTGGFGSNCGTGPGGFGGGGGSCPAGGGGYYGGWPGGNSPSSRGGGGGTSYRLTSGNPYMSSSSNDGFNTAFNDNKVYAQNDPGAGGRLKIVKQ